MKIASIVEGNGEVAALPILLRRLAQWRTPQNFTDVQKPIRVHRDRFLKRDSEFSRHLQLAAAKCGDDGWVLILLDADDDCPARLGPETLKRAREIIPHRSVSVVLANREFEAWFIAAASSLDGLRGFKHDENDIALAESPRNAKGWIQKRMAGRGYGETTDQPAFTAKMDLDSVHEGSRSFRKLCKEWDQQLALT